MFRFRIRALHVGLTARLFLILNGDFVAWVRSVSVADHYLSLWSRVPDLNWSVSVVADFARFLTVSMVACCSVRLE